MSNHGLSRHPLYGRWYRMVRRCTDPTDHQYCDYGGRGIDVHPDWLDVKTYIDYVEAELGKKPAPGYSIDRINNDGNYEPGNLRWASSSVQNANQRQRTSPGYPVGECGYKGVRLHRKTGLYQARLHFRRKEISLGYYRTPLEAALVYDAEAWRTHGTRARLNFPAPVAVS